MRFQPRKLNLFLVAAVAGYVAFRLWPDVVEPGPRLQAANAVDQRGDGTARPPNLFDYDLIADHQLAPEYSVTRSVQDGLIIYDAGSREVRQGPFRWLDNDKLLFNENAPASRNKETGEDIQRSSQTYVWQIDQGTYRVEPRVKVSPSIDDDVCSERTPLPKNTNVWVAVSPNKGAQPKALNDGCAGRTSPRVLREYRYGSEDRWGFYLRSARGYLNFSNTGRSEFVAFEKDGQKRLNLTAIPLADILRPSIFNIPFKGAYFIQSDHPYAQFPKSLTKEQVLRRQAALDCLPNWWFYEDGKSEKICAPQGPWTDRTTGREGVWFTIPVKNGMAVVWLRGYDRKQWEHQGKLQDTFGVYIFRDSRAVTWLKSDFQYATPDVSPNGCRIAVNHRSVGDDQSKFYVRVIDVCTE